MTTNRTKAVSVHHTRRAARRRERELQEFLDLAWSERPGIAASKLLFDDGLPAWARGVRVERIGLLQFAVIATEHRGR